MAHGRYELTEFEWKIIQPLLPNKPRGVPRVDDRRVLNGIFHHLCVLAHPGLICQSVMDLEPLFSIASTDGARQASGTD